MCLMTVALCGCDDDKQTTTQPATPVAKPVPAEPAEEAQPAVPVAKPVPAAPAADPDAVVATVNGTPIKNAAVTAELDKRLKAMQMRMQPGQEMPAAQIQQMRIGVVDMLAQQEVLHQKLAAQNITVSDDEIMARIGEIAAANGQSMDEVNEEIAQYGMTMDDLKTQIRPQVEMQKLAEASLDNPEMVKQAQAFYDENPAYFQTPEQVRASHVLIQVDREADDEAKAAAKAKAEEVLAKAKAGEDFAALAKEYSDDPGSKNTGGEYTFERGKMVKPFEDTAFAMEPGQISDLVETQFGYHIIKLSEKIDAATTPFDEAKEQIISYLIQKDMQENATIEYSKEEQALRDQARQQQMMQQQMMQQMMEQMQQQQQEAGND
jgi:peptidyl-prolyl cis-trans isomerase C